MRRLLILVGLAALAVAVVVGLSQTHTRNRAPVSDPPSAATVRASFAGSPAPLAALHAGHGRLLRSSPRAFAAVLRRLRGFPVVVNKWGSWCGPCRYEFPVYQQISVRYGRRVAFIGLDAADNAASARAFLARFPVSYPSYEDPDEAISRRLNAAPNFFPTTIFYDRGGAVAYQHLGPYLTKASLATDIERYLLGSAGGGA